MLSGLQRDSGSILYIIYASNFVKFTVHNTNLQCKVEFTKRYFRGIHGTYVSTVILYTKQATENSIRLHINFTIILLTSVYTT